MDAVAYSLASKQAQRIESFIENPDSTSGIVTVPKVIASGETVTIPAGRVAILPNVQIDGVLNVENGGEVFIPSGATLSTVVDKVTSTDNAIVRFDGTTGAVQNSGVIIDDNGNVGVGTSSPIDKLTMYSASGNLFSRSQSGTSALLTGVYSDGTTCVNSLGNYPLILLTNNAERMMIDTAGNVLLKSGTGGLGYGTGSGGTVTQLTSKSTSVTLNKPSGQIITSNSVLPGSSAVAFTFNNTLIANGDTVKIACNSVNYRVFESTIGNGNCTVVIENRLDYSLSEALVLNFTVIKGAYS